jgi:hypothetical protein
VKKNAANTKERTGDGNFGRMAPPQVKVLGLDYLVSCGRILPNERLSMTNLEENNISPFSFPEWDIGFIFSYYAALKPYSYAYYPLSLWKSC